MNTEGKPTGDDTQRALPGAGRRLWFLLGAACLVSVALELAVHRHSHFDVESWFGFYALLGLVGSALLVAAAKVLAPWLKTKEDYYDDEPR